MFETWNAQKSLGILLAGHPYGHGPVHPVKIPIPTKIGSKMGGAPTTIGFDPQPYPYPLAGPRMQVTVKTFRTGATSNPPGVSGRLDTRDLIEARDLQRAAAGRSFRAPDEAHRAKWKGSETASGSNRTDQICHPPALRRSPPPLCHSVLQLMQWSASQPCLQWDNKLVVRPSLSVSSKTFRCS